ncbi:MAG: FKBP-type peptidyl-prolyl cis-trans isomerase [Bacteroidales bacterium]|nr:FKBP-type peptidyl-prolyl cis-trans isomerase [Bacteroidales bacterium]
MKKILVLSLIALGFASCAKVVSESDNLSERRAYDAWVNAHYPEARRTSKGIYVLEEIPGSGEELKDSVYIYYNHVIRNLYDNSITSYNTADIAKQMNAYDKYGYYGETIDYYLPSKNPSFTELVASTDTLLSRMKVGGKRTLIIPGWITNSTKIYKTEGEYLAQVKSGKPIIFTIELVKQTKDIYAVQREAVEKYMAERGMPLNDTIPGMKGYYFFRDKMREMERGVITQDSVKFKADTTIYIEYIGRLLNGTVFDTNIRDTAIKWGLGTRESSYKPATIVFKADSSQTTFNGSTVIPGFYNTLWKMHPFQSAQGIFTSEHGYGASGTGKRIPAYSPLVFQIDIVDKPAN